MLDRQFPRAMHFCLIKAAESLHEISGSPSGTYHSTAEQHLGRLRAELDYASISEVIEAGLHEFIDRFQSKLNWVGEEISRTFFGEFFVTGSPAAAKVAVRSGGPAPAAMAQKQLSGAKMVSALQ